MSGRFPDGTGPEAVRRALEFIRSPSAERFTATALEVFAHQFARNEPYRRLCRARGVTPERVGSWEEIPAVPAAAFREARLTTAPASRVFATSGTTAGVGKRGLHHLPDLSLYEAAWVEPFRAHLLPDRGSMRILSLVPSERALPDSSLSYMIERVLERFGGPRSGRFFEPGAVDLPSLREAMRDAGERGEPVMLLGTAFAFAHLLDDLAARGERFALPAGSRVMDTGGFKGRGREVAREEILRLFGERLGVPGSHVVGEYGMTELSSQFYEPTLARDGARGMAWEGRSGGDAPGTAGGERFYEVPPWVRTRVLDPASLEPAAAGSDGLLAHLDLANAWTVSAIVTEDIGRICEGGFELRGRAKGAELRGCSLVTEELLGEV